MKEPGKEKKTIQKGRTAPKPAPAEAEPSTGRMHQNVPVWSDPTCACEAEPYWQAVAEEMEHPGEKRTEGEDTEPC